MKKQPSIDDEEMPEMEEDEDIECSDSQEKRIGSTLYNLMNVWFKKSKDVTQVEICPLI